MKLALTILLGSLMWGCHSAFYIGEEGEYLIVVNKKVPDEAGGRTLYTVKNISQESRFLSGSRFFNIHSQHVYHIGDTVQIYKLESGKDTPTHQPSVQDRVFRDYRSSYIRPGFRMPWGSMDCFSLWCSLNNGPASG